GSGAGPDRVDGRARASLDLGGPAAGGGAGAPGGAARRGLRLRRRPGSGDRRRHGPAGRPEVGRGPELGDPGAAVARRSRALAGPGRAGPGAAAVRLEARGRAAGGDLRALAGGDAQGGVDLIAVERDGVVDYLVGLPGALQGADLRDLALQRFVIPQEL